MKYLSNLVFIVLGLLYSAEAMAELSAQQRSNFNLRLSQVNATYPVMIDSNTRADKMWLLGNTVYLQLTGVNIDVSALNDDDKNNLTSKMFSMLRNQYCKTDEFSFFKSNGLNLSRILNDKNNVYLTEIKVSSEDCELVDINSKEDTKESITNKPQQKTPEIIKTTKDESKYRALFDVVAYNYPPYDLGSPVLENVYQYKKGDYIKLAYDMCEGYVCQVVTPLGSKAWVYGHKLTDNDNIDKALDEFNSLGMGNWSRVEITIWNDIKSDPSKIEGCALKLLYGDDFNKETDWPSYCNRLSKTKLLDSKLKELQSSLSDLSPSDSELLKMKEGKIWIGAKAMHLSLSWGTPDDVNSTITAHARKEQWVYSGGNYVYLTNGIVTAIQN
ncbi:hypothetical protein [Thalassotalea eurytherma]|uniref:SH3 domain-containing protein n=1 Tax=Thalassotalea eurytherma TaxID=1144278 RepID=A0ABQ6H4V4_9GAMM|nr:hypothetical protein [Thalassotalea eurytherma]GLX81857.1 hypothetical protein theurythT_13090 [Thalassotalea eurytherma]